MNIRITILLTIFAATSALADGHGYLAAGEDGGIVASGPFNANIPAPEGYRTAEPVHSNPRFMGESLQVSKAGFFSDQSFVLFHVETTDAGAGTINYGHLPTVNFAGRDFHTRAGCFAITAEELASDDVPVLEYIERQGFQVVPAIYARQLLLHTEDGSGEAGILYADRVAGCDAISDAYKAEFDQRFEVFVGAVRKANPDKE